MIWVQHDANGNIRDQRIQEQRPSGDEWYHRPDDPDDPTMQIFFDQNSKTYVERAAPSPHHAIAVEQRKALCLNAIEQSFATALRNRTVISDALGDPHAYKISSGFFDDVIMWSMYVARTSGSQSRKLPCVQVGNEAQGVQFIQHTERQLRDVTKVIALDGLAKQDEGEVFIGQLHAATTHEALDALQWPAWARKP